MSCEKVFPGVKSRNGNLIFVTNGNDPAGPFKVVLEDTKDKCERVGTIRNQNIRKNSMSMPAGRTKDSWNGNLHHKGISLVHANQIP
jgi:hypothetical protein